MGRGEPTHVPQTACAGQDSRRFRVAAVPRVFADQLAAGAISYPAALAPLFQVAEKWLGYRCRCSAHPRRDREVVTHADTLHSRRDAAAVLIAAIPPPTESTWLDGIAYRGREFGDSCPNSPSGSKELLAPLGDPSTNSLRRDRRASAHEKRRPDRSWGGGFSFLPRSRRMRTTCHERGVNSPSRRVGEQTPARVTGQVSRSACIAPAKNRGQRAWSDGSCSRD